MGKYVVFVRPTPNFKLLLEFDNHEYRVFDFSTFAQGKSGLVRDLAHDPQLFATVRLDGTGTICWDNDYDIAVEFLYANSKEIPQLGVV